MRRWIKIIDQFSDDDVSRLRKYSHAHHGANTESLQKILAAYQKICSEKQCDEIDESELRAAAFEIGIRSDKTWNKLSSHMLELIGDFLVWEQIRSQPLAKSAFLLEALNERELDAHVAFFYKKATNRKETDARSSFDFDMLCLIEAQREVLLQRTPPKDDFMQLIGRTADAEDSVFIIRKIKSATATRNYNLVFQKDRPTWLAEEVSQRIAAAPDDVPLVARLYNYAYRSMDPAEGFMQYELLREGLRDRLTALDVDDIFSLFIYAFNFCARRVADGAEAYRTEAGGLFTDLLRHKTLIHAGGLTPAWFKNVVVTLATVGKVDEARQWIDGFAEKLPDDQRATAVAYARAALCFNQGNYAECRRLLWSINDDAGNIKRRIEERLLIARCHVMLRDIMGAEYTLYRDTQYIQRHPLLSADEKAMYGFFFRRSVDFLQTFSMEKTMARAELQKLLDQFRANEQHHLLRWLRQQIASRLHSLQ